MKQPKPQDAYQFLKTICDEKKILNKTTLLCRAYDLLVERKHLIPHAGNTNKTRTAKRTGLSSKISLGTLSHQEQQAIMDAAQELLKEASAANVEIESGEMTILVTGKASKSVTLTQDNQQTLLDGIDTQLMLWETLMQKGLSSTDEVEVTRSKLTAIKNKLSF